MPAGPSVALISSARFAHLDEDLPLLVPALADLGIGATVTDWHDDGVAWGAFDLAIIRSTWDYTSEPDVFLAALRRIAAATELANPLSVVRGNIDKRYLTRLADDGLPVVRTQVLEPGDPVDLDLDVEMVVKPTVSAGGRDTERYRPDQRAAALVHASNLLDRGRAVLVQPYVEAVDEAGETGLVFVGDRFSHAFRKGPILRPDGGFVEGLYREEEISPRDPSTEELVVAERILDAIGIVAPGCTRDDLLYARVDLVPGPDGPMLMELELIEPSLFLDVSPSAPAHAARAIAAWLERG